MGDDHEEFSPGRDKLENISRLEITAMQLGTAERLADLAREAARLYDIDQTLLEGVEKACEEGDFDAIIEALDAFWEAVAKERGGL